MNLGIDLDGCVFIFNQHFVEYYNARFGLNDDYTKIDRWGWAESDEFQITPDQFEIAFEEYNKDRSWQSMPIYPEARAALCALNNMGCRIHYITQRPNGAERPTLKAILKNGLPLHGIFFAESAEDKITYAKTHGIDVAIDDAVHFIEAYDKAGIEVAIRLHKYNERLIGFNKLRGEHFFVKDMKDFADKIRIKLDS